MTTISFEAHRQLLHNEATEYLESRFSVVHKRATVSSFLFPEQYPEDPEYPGGYIGYRPTRTRVAPMPVPYDADADHPLLAGLEAACEKHLPLFEKFGLWALRHEPIHGLSTGEGKKMMILDFLLSRSRLLIMDEAFDGLVSV